jgi:hypothetical protein
MSFFDLIFFQERVRNMAKQVATAKQEANAKQNVNTKPTSAQTQKQTAASVKKLSKTSKLTHK